MTLELRTQVMAAHLTARIDEHQIDSIFEFLATTTQPGAAVGIALHGEPVYRKGFGLASCDLPVSLSPSMRLRIGSSTKHLTALCYLLLCEQGRAKLTDPLRLHVPEAHTVADDVRMIHLLTHTSGLRDSHDLAWQFNGTGHPITFEQMFEFYRYMDEVNAPPDTSWSYNNGGYLLLSLALERLYDAPLEEVLRKCIFAANGMRNTQLRRWDTDFLANSASLHMTDSKGRFVRSYLGNELTGEGGVVSTVDDMLLWLGSFERPGVGSCDTWERLKIPYKLANGMSTAYGCGLITSAYRGCQILSHPGGVMGGNAQILKVPGAGLDVVVLVNRHDVLGMDLAYRILDTCLPGLAPNPVGTHPACVTSGAYCSPTTGRVIELSMQGGQLVANIDGDDMPLMSVGPGRLGPIALWSFSQQRLTLLGDQQCPAEIVFEHYGTADRLLRVERGGASADDILGRYCARSAQTTAEIEMFRDGARLRTIGRFGSAVFRLEPLADGIWRARSNELMPWGGILQYRTSSAGFRWSTSRTHALEFVHTD